MQTKRVLLVGCVFLVLIQLCLADVDDDRQRGEIERARRRRKEELREARRELRLKERGKRHREHQIKRQQHLEAGDLQHIEPPQPLRRQEEVQALNERQMQRRRERKNRQSPDGKRVPGQGRKRSKNRVNLKSNELGNGSKNTTRANYVCPPNFMRLGHSCYFLSKHILSWDEAHHYCRDTKSHLASLETAWEDENIRNYINRKELARLDRWIGGRFNWNINRWIWGSSGRKMSYQGFSRSRPNEDRTWHCVFMDPVRHYKWAHKSCFEAMHFICEAPLHKEEPPKDGNEI